MTSLLLRRSCTGILLLRLSSAQRYHPPGSRYAIGRTTAQFCSMRPAGSRFAGCISIEPKSTLACLMNSGMSRGLLLNQPMTFSSMQIGSW